MPAEISLEARRSDVFFAFAVFQTSDRSEMMQICQNTHKRMTTEVLYIKQKGADERKIWHEKSTLAQIQQNRRYWNFVQYVEIAGDFVKFTK